MNILTLFHTLVIWYCSISASNARILNDKSYTPAWAVRLQISATDDDAKFIADSLGLSYQKILPDNYYLLTNNKNQDLLDKPNEQVIGALNSFSKVIWVEQQVAKQFESTAEFSDPLWSLQNQLKSNPPGYKISQHIEDVWAKGYTGKNVTVVVIDDGVRGTHYDLRNRYYDAISAIIANRSSSTSGHGSQCAGVIAAEANNNYCGVGVAYGCSIAEIKLFDADLNATDAEEAQAFYRDNINPSKADIFSNSWGPSNNGYTIGGPGPLATQALKHGVQKGRHGLGSIYVFGCGNGATVFGKDSCAFNGYVNSIYTIAVASITKDGKVTEFSEPCSAVMTAVYSENMVTISGESDTDCKTNFEHTSAATAFVSGILALALEANPNITWRDMQHLIARSSTWSGVDPTVRRVTNAKKYTVNENFGFGVLDASVLVDKAKKLNVSVPAQVMCVLNVTAERGAQTIPARINIDITDKNLNCSSKLIGSLEHVQLRVDLDYPNRAELSLEVQSSSGTPSKFIYPRPYDAIDKPRTYNNLVVTSVHFWGEPVLGKWIVDVKDINPSQRSGILLKMSLIFYGTTKVLDDNDNVFNGTTGLRTTPETTPQVTSDSSSSNMGAIVGGTIVGIVVLFVMN